MNDKIYTKLANKLSQNNYKVTSQRKDIIKVLINNQNKHYSAEELYKKVRDINHDVGLATIYRTLEILSKLNIVHQLDFDSNYRRYELNIEGHHHHHLICLKCGKIIEFNDNELEEFEKDLEKEYKFKISKHRIKFYGVCSECSERSNND
ncbi:MAG: Fur family transcriptional regulator [Halanaerobiales bacterium]